MLKVCNESSTLGLAGTLAVILPMFLESPRCRYAKSRVDKATNSRPRPPGIRLFQPRTGVGCFLGDGWFASPRIIAALSAGADGTLIFRIFALESRVFTRTCRVLITPPRWAGVETVKSVLRAIFIYVMKEFSVWLTWGNTTKRQGIDYPPRLIIISIRWEIT